MQYYGIHMCITLLSRRCACASVNYHHLPNTFLICFIILIKNRMLKSVPSRGRRRGRGWSGRQTHLHEKNARGQSQLFTVQCCQWEPIWSRMAISHCYWHLVCSNKWLFSRSKLIKQEKNCFGSSSLDHIVKDCPKDLSKVARKASLNTKEGVMKKGGWIPQKPVVTQLASPDEAPRA